MELTKKLIELILFFFSGVLFRLALSGELSYVYNWVLFLGAIAIVAYVIINDILGERAKEKISLLKDLLKEKDC